MVAGNIGPQIVLGLRIKIKIDNTIVSLSTGWLQGSNINFEALQKYFLLEYCFVRSLGRYTLHSLKSGRL